MKRHEDKIRPVCPAVPEALVEKKARLRPDKISVRKTIWVITRGAATREVYQAGAMFAHDRGKRPDTVGDKINYDTFSLSPSCCDGEGNVVGEIPRE